MNWLGIAWFITFIMAMATIANHIKNNITFEIQHDKRRLCGLLSNRLQGYLHLHERSGQKLRGQYQSNLKMCGLFLAVWCNRFDY